MKKSSKDLNLLLKAFLNNKIKTLLKNKIKTTLIIAFVLFFLFLIQRVYYFQDFSPTVIIESNKFESKTGSNLYQGNKINGEFNAKHNKLGIVSVNFDTHRNINIDYLQFSIKEKGQENWYYTNRYKVHQSQNNQYFPFGFPEIENSKNKTYQIEIESLYGSGNNSVIPSPNNEPFLTKYNFPKKYLLANPKEIPIYLFSKIMSLFSHVNIFDYVLIITLSALFFGILKIIDIFLNYYSNHQLRYLEKFIHVLRPSSHKTKYLDPINKMFFSVIVSILILLLVSSLIIIINKGHIESSGWLIYEICSVVIFISVAIFTNPYFKIKQIFLEKSLLLIVALFLIQIYFFQYVNHLISYRYLIFTTLAIIPAFYSYHQNYDLKKSLKILLINMFLIFYISAYFSMYIDLFSTLKFIIIILLTIFFYTYRQDKAFLIKNKIVIIISFFILILFVFLSTQKPINVDHYSFYVGPAYEISQGKSIISDSPSQYGYLSIHFIKSILEPIGINLYNFHLLNKTLFGLYFIGFFVIFIKITKNPILTILLTIIVTFFQTYFSEYGGTLFPSSGPLRFGFGLLVIFIILYLPKKYKIIIASLISSIAIFWSAETAIYIVPAFVFTIGSYCYINTNNLKETFKLFLRKISPFVFISCLLFVLILVKEYGYHKIFPPLSNYFEFATIYKNGAAALPIPLFGNYYVIILTLITGLTLAIYSIYQKDRDNTALAINFISIHNLAIFSYFIGRSHQNNIVNISPFIFLEVIMVYYYFTQKINKISKYYTMSFTLFFVIFFMIANNNLDNFTLLSKKENITETLQKYQQLKKEYSLTQDNVLILSYDHDTEIITDNKIKTVLPLNPGTMTIASPNYQQKYLIPNINKIRIGTTLVYTQDLPELFDFLKNYFFLKEVDPKTNKGIFSLYTIQTK